jgi:hypothetical protein
MKILKVIEKTRAYALVFYAIYLKID